MSEKQNSIIEFLLDNPAGADIQLLVEHLDITKTAVREHLIKLETRGLILCQDDDTKVGRPKKLYSLTPSGHESLPRQYSWLSILLLEELTQSLDATNVKNILKNLAKRVIKDFRQSNDKKANSKETIKEATKLLCDLGYRALTKQSDIRKGAIIEATNCVYHTVAKSHPVLCEFDIAVLENLTEMKVELTKCIAKNDSACQFCIKEK